MNEKIVMNPAETRQNRKKLRNGSTSAEAVLWNALKNRQLDGLKFRRQHGVGPYIVDFYCPELGLAVELDGAVHDNQLAEEYDGARSEYLRKVAGMRVLRFENKDVFRNQNLILNSIRECRTLRSDDK